MRVCGLKIVKVARATISIFGVRITLLCVFSQLLVSWQIFFLVVLATGLCELSCLGSASSLNCLASVKLPPSSQSPLILPLLPHLIFYCLVRPLGNLEKFTERQAWFS